MKKKKAYASAGVDVDLGNSVKSGIHAMVRSTHGPEVLAKVGGFGGLFRPDWKGMKDPVLVASTDGVGTKLKVAFATGRHDTIGQDLVNHCINDIAVTGAKPLFFLDYLASAELDPAVFTQILKGFTKACKAGKCALIGGETAQMPGMYRPGEYDVAGTIVGIVDRGRILDGSKIRPGDLVIGLPSNGLHTNGYSLARKVLFDRMGLKPESRLPELKLPLGGELLRVHLNYQPLLASLPKNLLRAAAHITGGGLIDNLPRILPPGTQAMIRRKTWKVPPIFTIIEEGGRVDPEEMFQVFNMGIGMVIVVPAASATEALKLTKGKVIGEITKGTQKTVLI
ncbi:MAG: phosphoribosylformylglycinamidine cyclo-ligase [Terrimicrobiaceae bacterium]